MKYPKILNWFGNTARELLVERHEPIVRQKQDADGNYYWQVDDYKLKQSLTFGTDLEVKIWLEQRHYLT